MISYWIIIAAGVAAECGAREWRAWVGGQLSCLLASIIR